MNTFDIYLKGGQVVTLRTELTLKQVLGAVYERDERETLLQFDDMTIVKSHISAIKDVTKVKELERDIVMSYDRTQPYKPWEEQK
jgi:polysaccharide deacetylase 2 family uncharacterized protein YibQ